MFNKITSHKSFPTFALITSSIIWGAASPIFKWSLENITPFTLAYLRFSIASVILFPFVINNFSVKKEDIKNLLIIGLSGVTVNIAFFFWALKFTSSINAVIIGSSAPIITLILSTIFLKEKPGGNILLGIFISLVGILVIFAEPFFLKKDGGSIFGDLLMLIATLGAVIEAIATKKIIGKYSPVVITFWSFVIGTVTFLPLLILEAEKPNWLSDLSTKGIIGILFGSIFSSAVAYLAYNYAIKKMDVSHVAVFTYLNPIVGIAIAIPLLGEKITLEFVMGAILVSIGVFVTKMHPHPFLHKKPI